MIGKKWLPTTRGAAGALGGSHATTCWASDHDREAGWTFYGLA